MARRKASSRQDADTLQMALVGYQIERQKIDDKIREIQGLLGGRRAASAGAGGASEGTAAPRKRNLSAAARKRIAMAQKRRWAEHRRKAAQAARANKPAASKTES